jgi:long-chain fatty acid transport protein
VRRILPNNALIQYAGGFQLNEHGARATAQGGAFAARASDPSAIFFNPAGMSFMRGTHLMVGTTLIAPSYSFYGPSNLNSSQEWEMKNNLFTPINAYFTNTWTDGALKGLAVGLGFTTPYGLGTEWDDDWVGRAVTREITLETYYLMPTVSYAINDFVSLGLGANIVWSNVKLRKAVTSFDPVMNLELDGNSKASFSWNAGIMIKPLDDVSIGFSYRAQTKIDYDGTADFHASESLKDLFPGGDVKTSITTPATWFAGIAWKPIENLEVEFDYQGIQWSSYDKLTIDFVTDATTNPNVKQADQTQAKDYKNTYMLRFGAEYRLPVMGLKLRAGYVFDKNPVPDKALEPMLPDADRHGVSIGAGINITPNITLDVSYFHLFFKDRTTSSTSYEGGVYLDGLYRGAANLYSLNISYQI